LARPVFGFLRRGGFPKGSVNEQAAAPRLHQHHPAAAVGMHQLDLQLQLHKLRTLHEM
jgi:hypothetical protein